MSINAQFEWKIEDFWVGIFWKTTKCKTDEGEKVFAVDVWICLIPCVPLHITIFNQLEIEPS